MRTAFERNYDAIFSAFLYFGMTGNAVGEDAYSLGLNQWSAFLLDCEIPDNGSKHCRSSDLDTMFIVTNYEEDKGSEINKENDDRALMSFEFLEIIVRVAIAKYIKSKEVQDVSDAVEMLCTACIQPNLCPEAVIVPNDFRERKLYFEEIAEFFEDHEPFLRAVYTFYAHLRGHKLMQMEGWISMCEACCLLGPKTGVSKRELKLIYAWSQMQISDEIKKRNKMISLTFVDFLEAVARLAELISPPTEARLKEYFHATNPANTVTPVWEYFVEVPDNEAESTRRASSEFSNEKTRPLLTKLEGVLEMMITQLVRNYGVDMPFEDPRNASPVPTGASSLPRARPSKSTSMRWEDDLKFQKAVEKCREDGDGDALYELHRRFHLRQEERAVTGKIYALAKTMMV